MWYDSSTELVNFVVKATANSYIALGFGDDMEDTEMSYWLTNDSGNSQQMVYSTEMHTPPPYPDDFNCYSKLQATVDETDNSVTFY